MISYSSACLSRQTNRIAIDQEAEDYPTTPRWGNARLSIVRNKIMFPEYSTGAAYYLFALIWLKLSLVENTRSSAYRV